MKTIAATLFCLWVAATNTLAEAPLFEAQMVFDPEQAIEPHGHVHASCIVECPNGDLRAVWYENGRELPDPYFNAQKDKAADVRIGGSRKQQGAKEWETPFVMSDTFGVSDNNPCMVIDKQGRLWLFHATLLGVPDWSWGSCVLRYMVASRYDHPGRPTWDKSNLLAPQVDGINEVLEYALEARMTEGWPEDKIGQARQFVERESKRPLAMRIGWMPRAHPIIRDDGAVLVPLANENTGAACVAITNDSGDTWTYSKLLPDLGIAQPSIAQFSDGTMAAFLRNDSGRIKRSDSTDGGLSWGPVTRIDRLHPNSGVEAIGLANGKLLLVYNDTEKERDSLAVSLSADQGKTWSWTRHIEKSPGGRFDYPSVVQSKDGSIHVTYSFNLKTIKHARFNEAWITEGGE